MVAAVCDYFSPAGKVASEGGGNVAAACERRERMNEYERRTSNIRGENNSLNGSSFSSNSLRFGVGSSALNAE